MTELIKIVDTMSSVQIAELTGKQHAHVMRDIRNMIDNLQQSNQSTSGCVNYSSYVIKEDSYKDAKGEQRTMFSLNKKACLLLASGYNVILRAKIIDRWEELENDKRVNNPAKQLTRMQLAQMVIESEMENERLALENEQQAKCIEQQEVRIELQSEELKKQAPKVKYHDEVLTSTSTYNTTNIAKEFGMGAPSLNKILHEKGVQYKSGGQWLLYSKYQDRGYTRTVTNTYDNGHGEVHTRQQTVWTEKGRQFIHSLLTPNTVAI